MEPTKDARLIAAAQIWAGLAVQDAIVATKEGVRTFTSDELSEQAAKTVNELADMLTELDGSADSTTEWTLHHGKNSDFRWIVEWNPIEGRILKIRIARWLENVWCDSEGSDHSGWEDDQGDHVQTAISSRVYSKPLASFANKWAAGADFMRFILAA